MKRDPVYLNVAQRKRAIIEIVRSFAKRDIKLTVLSIDRIHLHALARMPDLNPRHHMGVAKRECSHYMKVDVLAPVGGLWGVRSECRPIRNSMHFENVVEYVLDHRDKGAAVWSRSSVVVAKNDMDDFDPKSLLPP